MSWRRKCSKGSRTNPVDGAIVINKGGGGGDKVRFKAPQWVREEAKRLEREGGFAVTLTRADKDRAEDVANRLASASARKRAESARAREAHIRWLERQSQCETYDWAEDPEGMAECVGRDSNLTNFNPEVTE